MVTAPASVAQDIGDLQDTAVEPDADASDASAKSKVIPKKPIPLAERSERLQRRAGEKVGGDARGRTVVLGMHIQEADNERATVIEVGPTSPAFDAGIREGDEIMSFDGFKADTYREWVDGMRRLATDAPDGDTLPIILVRDGKRLNLRLRVPESRAGALPQEDPLALNQQVAPGQQPGQPGVVVPGQQPTGRAGGGGDNILIADAFGDQFNSSNSPNGGTTEGAIAEIFLLNPLPSPAAGNNAQGLGQQNAAVGGVPGSTGGAASSAPGARVGLAGFRNDANGLFVMLDVGGLPPGNYVVGVDDPSVLAAGGNAGAGAQPPTVQRSGGVDPRSSAVQQEPGDRFLGPNGQRSTGPAGAAPRRATQPGAAPSGAAPSGGAPSGSQPAGGGQPQGRREHQLIPRTVLAQVIDPSQPDASDVRPPSVAGPSDIPPAGIPAAGQDPSTPGTSDVPPPGATSPGQPRTADGRRDPTRGTGAQPGIPPGAAGPALRIGTLAVDQSGTGRLQQVVEGVQVQDVVGQAIAIYTQNVAPQTTLPPNLDPSADPGVAQAPAGTTRVGGAPGGAAGREAIIGGANAGPNLPPNPSDGTVPVAGGLIRSMSDGAAGGAGQTQTGDPAAAGQTPLDSQGGVPTQVPNAEPIR